jgi:tripartite-type tricarboxylate transporter receptor subunit TctC
LLPRRNTRDARRAADETRETRASAAIQLLGLPALRSRHHRDTQLEDAMTPARSRFPSRRHFLCALPLPLAVAATPAETTQAWPRHAVRLVLPADGGRGDAMARTLAVALMRRWRQPVIVEYRPGGDGMACVESFLAARDDHVLLLNPTSVWTTLHLRDDTPSFDPAHDLVPLAPIAQDVVALAVAPKLGLGTLAAAVEAARRSPTRFSLASTANGPDLAFAAFLRAAGIDLALVPHRHAMGSLTHVVEGRADFAFLPLPLMIGAARAGKVRLVAVASPERASVAPAVPTTAEAGFPSLVLFNGHGLFGPRDMADTLRARVAEDVAAAVRDPAVAERLARMGYRPCLVSPAGFQTLLQRERAHWTDVAQAAQGALAAQ